MLVDPVQILQSYFGYSQFRPGQLPIVQALLNGQDVLALLPTGGGKSICFQVPALSLPGTTLVISPLISLMMDQVKTLHKRGVAAAYLSSQQSLSEQEQIKIMASRGAYTLLYLAPERLTTTGVGEWLTTFPISLVIFDEAHCISEWGHDFRPSYRDCLGFMKKLSVRPPIGAFTATATPETQLDICQVLQLQHPRIFKASFQRQNLTLQSIECLTSTHKIVALGRILKKFWLQPTIIYCSSRATTEHVAYFLKQTLYHWQPNIVAHYHAELAPEEKEHIQQKFLEGQIVIMVATTAFGMGVDKPDVRIVLHYHLPPSIESYYQEIGRAGRDGALSRCFLLYSHLDLKLHQSATKLSKPAINHKSQKISAMWKLARSYHCRMKTVLHYFGEVLNQNCQNCDRCCPNPLLATTVEKTITTKLKKLVSTWRHIQPQSWQDVLSQRLIVLLAVYQPETDQALATLPGIGCQLLRLKPPLVHAFSQCYGLSTEQTPQRPISLVRASNSASSN